MTQESWEEPAVVCDQLQGKVQPSSRGLFAETPPEAAAADILLQPTHAHGGQKGTLGPVSPFQNNSRVSQILSSTYL